MNFAKVLNLALNGGVDKVSGVRVYEDDHELKDFKTFEEVFEAWRRACNLCTEQSIIIDTAIDTAIEDMVPDILCSGFGGRLYRAGPPSEGRGSRL